MEIKKVGVIGGGTMGAGIIQVAAQSGFDVVFKETNEAFIEKAIATVAKFIDKKVVKGKITAEERDAIMDRIRGTLDFEDLADRDIIIEAVPEKLEIKQSVFKELDRVTRPDTILCTNTSGLSITEIASVTQKKDKVIGMHFFSPVPAMKLVEVIKGGCTSEETCEIVMETARAFGKDPVKAAEAPGFIVNRMLDPILNEAVAILAEGIASAEDIDKAMRLGANHPMGPLELGDMEGLDICVASLETMYRETGMLKFKPHPLLVKMVRSGKLGIKTGEGFYKYNQD